jgi:hypothetical protein
MIETSIFVNNFTSGEISPRLRGRFDLSQYQNSARTLQNFTVMPQGGATRRPGTKYVAAVKNQSTGARLVPFEFNTEQAYILEFGANYIRFFKDNGQILDSNEITNGTFDSDISNWGDGSHGSGSIAHNTNLMDITGGGTATTAGLAYQELTSLGVGTYTITATTSAAIGFAAYSNAKDHTATTITNITKANPGVVTSTAHGLSNGDTVRITGVVGMTEVNGRVFTVANATANTFELSGIDTSGYTTRTSGGTINKVNADGTGSLNGTAQTVNFTPTESGTVWIYFENQNNDTRTLDDVSISNPIYEIESPWTLDQVHELQYAQSADVVYLVQKNTIPRKLTRTGHDAWTLEEVSFEDGPYFDTIDSQYGGVGADFNISMSGTTGSITVTANEDLFASTDVGRLIRYRHNDTSEWGYVEITAYSSATSVSATVLKTLSGTAGSKEWRLGAWSGTTGYPRAISFHDQRLYFAGSTAQPQTLWGSTAGDIENFQPDNDLYEDEVDADTAVTFTIASTKANVIEWLNSRKALFLGTSNTVFEASASELDSAITPDNITVNPAVQVGAHSFAALSTQNATIFIQYFQTKLQELAFSFEEDSFKTADLSLLSNHLTRRSITGMERQEEPDNIIWCTTSDGSLLGMTYLREQKVVAWHQHILGGVDTAVESIASIPGTTETQLWAIVKRTVNGGTKRYVEYLTPYFNSDAIDKEDAFFVDSGLTFTASTTSTITGVTKANPAVVTTSAAHGLSDDDVVKISGVGGMTELNGNRYIVDNATSTTFELKNIDSSSYTTYTSGGTALELGDVISGLDHLEGETVSILGDGSPQPNRVVSSGSITLSEAVETAQIGLPYESVFETNNLETPSGGQGASSLQGSKTRIYEAVIRFYETLGAEYGTDNSNLDEVIFRESTDAMDASPALFSGDKVLKFPGGWSLQPRLYIKQSQPLPITILSIQHKIISNR